METRSKRRETEPIVDKIRRGEISVFVAVAEELPEVFRTHVVPKLGLLETLNLAKVSKYYNAAVWSVEAVESLDEKAKVAADREGHTALPSLISFAWSNNIPGLRTLLSTGVDLSQKCQKLGVRALLHAAKNGSLEAVNLLSEAGADVNGRSRLLSGEATEQDTPLVMAICLGHAAVVSALVEAGANLESKGEWVIPQGGTFWAPPLMLAAYYLNENDEEIMKLLLDAGANPNSVLSDTNPKMMTLLHALVLCDICVNKARLLLEAGADPNAIDEHGDTPLDYAVDFQNPEMTALLKKWTGLDDSE
jgi:ankyrin repeat protein